MWLVHPEKDSNREFRVYGSPVLLRSEGVSSPLPVEHFVGVGVDGTWVPVVMYGVPLALHPTQPSAVLTIPGRYRISGASGNERVRLDDYKSLETIQRVEGVIS